MPNSQYIENLKYQICKLSIKGELDGDDLVLRFNNKKTTISLNGLGGNTDLSNYYTKTQIDSKGYLTSSSLTGYVDKTSNQTDISGNKTFTGTTTLGNVTASGHIIPDVNATRDLGNSSLKFNVIWANNFLNNLNVTLGTGLTSSSILFRQGSGSQLVGGFHATTGNFFLQPAGVVPTDAGYRLDVNGTTRSQGLATFSGGLKLPNGTDWVSYNTVDETTNYERVRGYWSSNVYTIGIENNGTGVARNISINTSGSVSFLSFANFARSTSTGGITPVIISGTDSNSSLINSALGNFRTINQSGTAGYRGIWVSPYEQATGSGEKLLLDLGTNSAANGGGTHTSKFKVTNSGRTTIADLPVYADNTAASGAGLSVGTLYKTSTGQLMAIY